MTVYTVRVNEWKGVDTMSELLIEDMTNEHLVNRIAWCKRQKIDTWAVHGDEPKYGAGGYMDSVMNDFNNKIDDHIDELKAELANRSNFEPTEVEIL
jgi:hypothetical protein